MVSKYSAFNRATFDKNTQIFETDYWRSDEEAVSNFLNKGRLLVAGVGTGRVIPYLLERGFASESMEVIDISPKMIEACKRRFPYIQSHVMDIQDTAFKDNSFDSVFLPAHTMTLVDNHEDVLREIWRILKPGGTLAFNMHNRFRAKNLLNGKAWRPRRILDTFDEGRAPIYATRGTFFDLLRFRSIFVKVSVYGRISLQKIPNPNWKDRLLIVFPFLDRSLYFFCTK